MKIILSETHLIILADYNSFSFHPKATFFLEKSNDTLVKKYKMALIIKTKRNKVHQNGW